MGRGGAETGTKRIEAEQGTGSRTEVEIKKLKKQNTTKNQSNQGAGFASLRHPGIGSQEGPAPLLPAGSLRPEHKEPTSGTSLGAQPPAQ